MRVPAEVFPPGEYIRDEIEARGWSLDDLASRMGTTSKECGIWRLVLDFTQDCQFKGVLLGEDCANALSRAFGSSAELWLELDRRWQEVAPEMPKR